MPHRYRQSIPTGLYHERLSVCKIILGGFDNIELPSSSSIPRWVLTGDKHGACPRSFGTFDRPARARKARRARAIRRDKARAET